MKASSIVKTLNDNFPNPKSELKFTHDYEIVLSTMLSAQTTDRRVNEVTKNIYKKYDTLQKLDGLTINQIEKLISSLSILKV